MPTASVSVDVAASADKVFELLHDYSRRLEWDPFLREAVLLHGATAASVGVHSVCKARWAMGGLAMETEYISFNRPTVAAVTMTAGPVFLKSFAATIRHEMIGESSSRATYKYRFECTPRWLGKIISPLLNWTFRRETVRRLEALKEFSEQVARGEAIDR